MILQSLLSTFILCFNVLNNKTFFSSQHITSHRTCTSRPAGRAAPRLAHAHGLGPARPDPASERARMWFTDLLLPDSQVVYMKSTL